MKLDAIALDLEGTLISNAVSQFPRPGLHGFVEFCRESCRYVVIYTAVRREVCEQILSNLVAYRAAPSWFESVPYIEWDLRTKDLRNIPDVDPARCIIVDDHEGYILPEQYNQWIRVSKYAAPYDQADDELARAKAAIRRYLTSYRGLEPDHLPPLPTNGVDL